MSEVVHFSIGVSTMAFIERTDWVDTPSSPPPPGSTPVYAEDILRWERGIAEAHETADAAITVEEANATYVRTVNGQTVDANGDVTVGLTDNGTPLGSVPRFAPIEPTVLTNFEPGHGWTVQSAGGGTSQLNDTTDFAFGTQSIRLTTGGAGASVIVQNLAFPAVPDGRMLRLWVKINAPDTVSRIRIFAASDAEFTNFYTLETFISSASVPEIQRPFKAGEWVPIAFPWSTAVATGTPDRNALTFLRILINDRGSSTPATIRLGRIEHTPYPVPLFPNGVVSLTYDDTFAAHFTTARPHLDKYGFSGVLFPILERLDQAGYLTTAQVDRLVYTHGWEVGAHATTYAKHTQSVTGMSSAERAAEFAALKKWLQERGYAASSFAYPNGYVDAASALDLRSYFGSGRLALGRLSANGADEMQNPSLPSRIYSQNCGNLSVAQIQGEIDRAIANKAWLILMFHNLPAVKGDANDFAAADHAAVVDYLHSSGVAVRTMDQVRQASVSQMV